MDNSISEVSEADLSNFASLIVLKLNTNLLTKLPEIPASLNGILRGLDLGNNQISTVSADKLNSLTALTSLYLGDNLIIVFPTIEIATLSQLRLENNQINESSIDALLKLPSLKTLRLSNNQMHQVLNTNATAPLRRISADNNQIMLFPNLTMHAGTIKTIILSHNLINYINPSLLDPLENLVELDLGFNQLTEFPDISGPGQSLRELKLHVNPFTAMPDLAVIGRSLRTFLFYGNTVATTKDFLKGMKHLQKIDFHGSTMTSFPVVTQLHDKLQTVNLKNVKTMVFNPQDMYSLGYVSTEIHLNGTSFINPLASMCHVKPGAKLYLTNAKGIDFCSCDVTWMKMAVDRGMVILVDDDLKCMDILWREATTEQFMQVCTNAILDKSQNKITRQIAR